MVDAGIAGSPYFFFKKWPFWISCFLNGGMDKNTPHPYSTSVKCAFLLYVEGKKRSLKTFSYIEWVVIYE